MLEAPPVCHLSTSNYVVYYSFLSQPIAFPKTKPSTPFALYRFSTLYIPCTDIFMIPAIYGFLHPFRLSRTMSYCRRCCASFVFRASFFSIAMLSSLFPMGVHASLCCLFLYCTPIWASSQPFIHRIYTLKSLILLYGNIWRVNAFALRTVSFLHVGTAT